MDRRLFRPRWLLAHIAVLALAALFVSLGFWQLRRLEERRAFNTLGTLRLSAEPVPLNGLLGRGHDPASLEYRRVTVTGRFDVSGEVLVRSQVFRGTAGFHVITPLVGERGIAVLVNRGWVPLGFDHVPVEGAPPPAGEVTIEGWVHLTQMRPSLGPEDPAKGRLTTLSRVDVGRIQQQVDVELAPVYVIATSEWGSELPVPAPEPDFSDDGPHLSYAIQWFGFALIGLIGYVFLARRRLGTSRLRNQSTE